MSKEAALILLDRLDEKLSRSKSRAEAKGLVEYYNRDIRFLEEARSQLRSNDRQGVQWVFDQMRNLSQGFGSYSDDLKAVDAILDQLFAELKDALTK